MSMLQRQVTNKLASCEREETNDITGKVGF